MVNKMVTKMVPHYGLRKLSVGVASVLLGTTIYGYNVAHADTLSVGNTNENENTNAGGQVPYQEGKNANAVNDNKQQTNNQENVVNDQQTPYADSLAVLNLNNNYQKNSLATQATRNKDGSAQTVNNNENNDAVNKSRFNTSNAIPNSQSYWQQNALQSNLVQTRKVRPADSVDPKGWSVRPLVYGSGNSGSAVYGSNMALNYNISILDGSGWLYDHTDSTVTVVPGGYKVPMLNGNAYRVSNGNTYVESLVYLWKNQADYGNDYPDAYAYILTDSKPMHATGWSGDDTRLVVIADPAGNIISDLSGQLKHPIESMRPKILSSVNYQIDYIDNVTGKVIKSQKVSEFGSGVHNISYTIPSGYRIAGSNDYPTVVTSDNGILKFDGNVLNRHVTQGSVIPVKIAKSNTADLTSTEVKLHQGIWLNQDVFAKTHPTIVVNSDNATDKGELVTSYDGVEKYALDSDAAGRVKQIQIDGTGLVASVTFQGNLGNLVDESGNKLTAINKVVRDYYSLEPGGRLAIYKESENMFGFAHSPFYLNGFLYAGAKAIRIVTHYYDANGNELHIPINSDVLPVALSGMHTYSGTVNGVLLDSSNKSNLASNQSVNVKTSSDGLTLISSRPGDHYSWKPVGASGTSQGDGYIIGAFDLSTGKPSVGNSNNLGYVSLAQPYQIRMNDTQNMQMVHSVRRIHFVDSNGNKVHDDVTQNISWLKIFQNGRQLNSLQDKSFSSMATPTLKGYMPSVDVIPAETVSPSSLVNEDYTVTYSLASVIKVKLVKLIPDKLNTNDAYALNPKNNMHEHRNVNDNGGFDKDYWGTVDPTYWNYTVRGDVISLDGLKSGDSQHVIIPNIADFQVKGIDHGAKRVIISSSVMRQIAEKAHTIALSKTNNQKIGASDQNWSDAFGGTTQAKTSDGDPGISAFNASLERMDLHNFDTSNIVNMYQMFNWGGFSSLGDLSEWDTSHVTNMNSMFNCAGNIEDLGNLDHWNTQWVEDMSWMFSGTFKLSNVGNLGKWETGNVTNMYGMFDNAESIDGLGNLGNWNVSNVINMGYMFQGAKALSSIGDLSHWKVGNVKDFSYMFSNAESLKDLGNIDEWDTSQVTDMGHMFYKARSLTNIGKLNKWDTGNVTSMMLMFARASLLSDIGNLDNWNTSRVTNMTDMFGSDSRLTNIGDLSNWDVSHVTDLSDMFVDDSALQNVGNLSRWNIGEVTDATRMFGNAVSLKELDISNWNFSKMERMGDMFARDSNLVLIANNIKLPSDYSNRLPRFDAFSNHMAVITDNDQLLKSTGNTDDYTIDGQKFMRPIFYQSNGSSDAVTVIKAANQKLMDGYTAKHPDKLLKYDSSQNMTDPIALANASFVTAPNNVDTMITFVISDSHLVGSDLVLNGPSQTKIDPNGVKIPDGYILDGSLPDMYYGNNYTIKLKRKQIPITDVSELNATITVTYKFNVIDKYASDPRFKTQTQILHFKRTGYVDGVTGQKVFTDWQATDSAKAVTVPKLTGYDWDTGSSRDKEGHYTSSLDPKDVNAVALDFVRDKNGNDSITYSINAVPERCNQEIDFVDSDGNNHTMTVVEAFYDTVLNVNEHMPEMPDGWRIVPGQNIPKTVTMSFNGKPIKIRIEHIVNPVKPGEHGVPAQAFEANPKRTIIFNVPGEYADKPQYKKIVQTVHFTRNITYDEVTKQVLYGPWKEKGNFSEVNVPELAGYKTSMPVISEMAVTGDTKDITISVGYVAEKQSQLINYVDSVSGKAIHQQKIDGVTDQTVNVSNEIPTNWKLADDQTLPSSIMLTNNPSPLTVKITHVINPATPSPDGPFPAGTQKSDWYRTVKHFVNFEVPSKYADNPLYKQIVQTINFSRKGQIDAVTGKITYFGWQQDNKFVNVTVPALSGYSSSETTVIAPAVNADSKDIVTDVTYTPDQQSQLINYVDTATGKTIHQQMVSGVTDQTVNVVSEVPANWKLANGQTFPTSITLANNSSPLTVKITHQINSLNPPVHGPYPFSTLQSDWYRTVRHIINFKVSSKYADNQLYKQVVQTINFSRKGEVDAVTGKVNYFDWQQDNKFINVTVPGLDGYTPSQTTVIAPVVNADSKDIITDVTYMANPSSVRISYVDNDNREISHQDFSGVTDQNVNINAQLPANWKLASGQQVPEVITLLARPRTIQVVVEHIVNNVQPGENGPWPGNTQKSDWYRTVTRTISFKVPDKYSNQSQFKMIVQTVNFKRSGHLDTVINKVTFDAWQRTGQFDVVKVPGLTGYTTNYVTVDQVVPGADDQNSVVDVTYTPKAESQLINYVDANGQVIHRQKVDGKMDDTIKVTPDIPAHWKLSNGVSVPKTITLMDQPAALSYQIEHIIDNLTPSENGPYPHGTKKSDWFRTVTRTINFAVPSKYSKEPQFKTITQSVNFKRTGHYDQALDKVSFDPWQRAGQFDAVKVSQLFGYTTSTDQVVGEVPTENSSNQTVNVAYAPQTATLQINFVTPDGQPVSHVDDKGVFDTVIDLGINWRNDLPSGYQMYDRNIDQDLGSLPVDFLTKTINVMVVPTQTMKTQTKTVTRRIHLQMPNGAEQVVTQSAVFTRKLTMQTGSKDPVEVSAWSPDAWLVAYQPSHLDGYTIDNVKSVLVSGDSNDQDVYLKYQAIAQPTTVTFALTNGQIIDSVKVDDLKTAQVNNLVPKGYHLLNSEAGASRLLVEPDMVTYNGNMSNVPSNVGELKRTVKRTIIMTLANGRTRRIVQQVRFTRTATVNQATGEIMYGDWHAVGSSKFNRINVPKRAGKTIRILGGNVNAVAVNANMHDSVVRVRYI